MRLLVGGWIEMLPVPDSDQVMVVNEKGKLKGLPYNAKATAIMGRFLEPGVCIVGSALLCDRQLLDRGDED